MAEVQAPVIPYVEWLAQGKALFGDDFEQWEFRCPHCKLELSMAEAREQYPELKGCKWYPPQECIGRYTDRVDCDWCAYGLFRGPLLVEPNPEAENKKPVPCFEFATVSPAPDQSGG